MKLELNTLLTAQQALGTLGNTRGLSSVVAYRISKNIKAITKEIEVYEESRIKLLEEHSYKDDEKQLLTEMFMMLLTAIKKSSTRKLMSLEKKKLS